MNIKFLVNCGLQMADPTIFWYLDDFGMALRISDLNLFHCHFLFLLQILLIIIVTNNAGNLYQSIIELHEN